VERTKVEMINFFMQSSLIVSGTTLVKKITIHVVLAA
jgi:hypothetical protein